MPQSSYLVSKWKQCSGLSIDTCSGLDNVPSEVAHLLLEIKTKDEKITGSAHTFHSSEAILYAHFVVEIQAKLHARAQRQRAGTLTPMKEQNMAQKSVTDLDKIDKLSDEKIMLAERLVATLNKACGRLEQDLTRVRVSVGQPAAGDGIPGLGGGAYGYHPAPRVQMDKVVDHLRAAIAAPDPTPQIMIPPSIPLQSQPKRTLYTPCCRLISLCQPQIFKGRRTTASQAGTTNHVPITLTHAHQHVPRAHSRLSTQIHPQAASPISGTEEDAEGEEDADEDANGDQEDQQLYCVCQKMSYGEVRYHIIFCLDR